MTFTFDRPGMSSAAVISLRQTSQFGSILLEDCWARQKV